MKSFVIGVVLFVGLITVQAARVTGVRNKGTNGFMLTLDIDADTAPPKAKATGM